MRAFLWTVGLGIAAFGLYGLVQSRRNAAGGSKPAQAGGGAGLPVVQAPMGVPARPTEPIESNDAAISEIDVSAAGRFRENVLQAARNARPIIDPTRETTLQGYTRPNKNILDQFVDAVDDAASFIGSSLRDQRRDYIEEGRFSEFEQARKKLSSEEEAAKDLIRQVVKLRQSGREIAVAGVAA